MPRSSRLTDPETAFSDEVLQHNVMAEMLARDRPCATSVALVVGVDALDSRDRFLLSVIGKEAFACGHQISESGVLRNHRPTRREVLRTAFAEPTAAEPHILVLGHREFPTGLADVVAVLIEMV